MKMVENDWFKKKYFRNDVKLPIKHSRGKDNFHHELKFPLRGKDNELSFPLQLALLNAPNNISPRKNVPYLTQGNIAEGRIILILINIILSFQPIY